MHNGLYITATGPMTGKSAIALGAMQLLTRSMRKVAFFRPIINEPLWDDRDPDIHLMLEYFKLNMDYADTFAYTQHEARQIINQGSRNLLIENIIQKYKKLLETYDFVLCVGTDFLAKDPVFEFELNAEIAANLGCPILLVTSGYNVSAEDIRDSLQITMDSLEPYALDVVATIVNRRNLTQTELDELRGHFSTQDNRALIFSVPNDPTNEARALRLLEANGIIKIKPGALVTVADITENPLGLKFHELDAAQLPRTLDDVTASVINTNFAGEAGLVPARDALVMEGSESPYANIVVVRNEDKDSPKAKALMKAVQSPEVKEYIQKNLVERGIVPVF